jgi:hypothetical protein
VQTNVWHAEEPFPGKAPIGSRGSIASPDFGLPDILYQFES